MTLPFWDSPNGAFDQWIDDLGEASVWDVATLGGRKLPGLVKVDGAEVGRKWDVKTGPGIDGATTTDQGYEVAKPTLTLLLWTPEQWEAWQDIVPLLVPKPGKATKKPPTAVPVTHPALNGLGINNLLILSLSAPKPASPKGAFEVTIKTVQWLPSKKAPVQTPGSFNIPTTAAVEPPKAPAGPAGSGGAAP
jgi:hypothetical protein